ncbi:MAG: hypothetical protein KGJ12_08275, partial [Gammaproteobacteria bacterium]|nr:hypothetical protein [Gammaproteobacteria bacterium]
MNTGTTGAAPMTNDNKRNNTMRTVPYILAGSLLMAAVPTQAHAAESPELARLRQQLKALEQRYQTQGAELRALAKRVKQLEKKPQARRTVSAAPAPRRPATQAAAGPQPGEHLGKQPPQSRSAQAVYQQQNALFTRRLTIEPGFVYTYYDRNQLNL